MAMSTPVHTGTMLLAIMSFNAVLWVFHSMKVLVGLPLLIASSYHSMKPTLAFSRTLVPQRSKDLGQL